MLFGTFIRILTSLLRDFCTSDRNFASTFFQIPPHDGHPWSWLVVGHCDYNPHNRLSLSRYMPCPAYQKNTIRHLYRITIELLEYAHISSYVGCTYIILFTNPIIDIQKKKTNSLYYTISYNIHIYRHIWLCEYVYDPSNKLQSNNRKEHKSN